ncbi:DUF2975 domain-containing protein [Legionella taurinensis]|uniref:DUF2975 domain-containing protein n=1 Tax=Legionella taurinensis TaxID=70611 RepID=A0A3A5L3P8_9GAMM|nr:DUF2975 domain-containing protein [Legionella taurinensis]RJT46635.1 DUF2975 domain-containing protein [Legionella taurinensis]RJT66589.1 DUF2975 domain-containing protein [Legionella taurinensis]STY25235.1 Protein of uncharacterised function (DUF2975) [Legionella taurinensis]
MEKIQRISLFFRVLFQVLFIALPLFLITAWVKSSGTLVIMGGAINLNYIPAAYANSILHTLSGSEKFLGLCLSSIPMFVQLYILFALINLFKLYEKGEIFSINNVRSIRNIGYALLITQIIDPIYQGAMGFVLTRYNPSGHRFAAITLDQTNIGVVLIALIVILISWIMVEGCKLREEQQLTV